MSVEDLGQALADDKLSARTLQRLEAGERPFRPMELRAIAHAVDLPFAFFEAEDFSALAESRRQSDEAINELADRIDALTELVTPLLRRGANPGLGASADSPPGGRRSTRRGSSPAEG